MNQLPEHLKKYVVEQNYEKYTSQDQACWRYILRQLTSFLSKHAHECYLDGLSKTGILVDHIPRIEDISKKLEEFGWRALPVSGFIPPAAFMELQSLGVLPIASDMRTLEHLSYTPAPDIVHEAAGHAPILINPDFANYLKEYAQVAKHAIISKEDLDIYDAIRELSDLKESPHSNPEQIAASQSRLENLSKSLSHVSEASELSRMNWWTAEYGLIGDINAPKIFGAGLLSSVGESKWCLGDKVKKIPLSMDCIRQTYDITEPQPQLFVTPDFKTLSRVLDEMASMMAFKTGGLSGLKKAIQARSANTAQLNSGIQVSGVWDEAIVDAGGNPVYIRTIGPTQLCIEGKELNGHSKSYHDQGFGSPVGRIQSRGSVGEKCLSKYTDADLQTNEILVGKKTRLEFKSGVIVEGLLTKILRVKTLIVLMSFENCKVVLSDLNDQHRVLFEPAWGTYDMIIGSSVTSVFGGPADRVAYGVIDDFQACKVPAPVWSAEQLTLQTIFARIRLLRDTRSTKGTPELAAELEQHLPDQWLPKLELLELVQALDPNSPLVELLKAQLAHLAKRIPAVAGVIADGLVLSSSL